MGMSVAMIGEHRSAGISDAGVKLIRYGDVSL
jgi:hypothetical protein